MNRRPTIKINQGRLLPIWLRLTISLGLFTAIVQINNVLAKELAIGLSILIAAPVLPLWNAFQVLEFESFTNSYRRVVWFAGLTFGRWKKYGTISGIEIKKTGIINKLLSGKKSYESYLVLDEEKQVYMLGNRSKEVLLDRLKEINEKLDLKLNN